MSFTNSTLYYQPPRIPIRHGKLRILLLVGGTFQSLTRHLAAANADLVLYLDCEHELGASDSHNGVLRLALASGETIGTLAGPEIPEALKEYFASRPGVNLNLGLGQLRALGKLAAKKLLESPEFKRFLVSEVFESLFVRAQGVVRGVEVTVCTSTAGGTGGPAGRAIAQAVASVFLSKLGDVPVEIQCIRVGGLTYVGLGDRTQDSTAATLVEDVTYALASNRLPTEIRSLCYVELPMVLEDKKLREDYVVQLMQALRSPSVRTAIERVTPNAALDTRLGAITILRASWWKGLPQRRITAAAARQFLPRLAKIIGVEAQAGLVESVELKLGDATPVTLASIDDLIRMVRDAGGDRPAELTGLATKASRAYGPGTVKITIRGSVTASLEEHLRVKFARRSQTETEFREKVSALRAIDQALAREQARRNDHVNELEAQKQRIVASLARALDRLFPGTVFGRLANKLGNAQEKTRVLRALLSRARAHADEIGKLSAEAALLADVRQVLQDEMEAELKRLRLIVEVLEGTGQVEDAINGALDVEVGSLDEVFAELLESAVDGQQSQVQRVLSTCVRRVTLSGLAQITGAVEPRPDCIARKLIHSEPDTVGPPWGGKLSLGPQGVVTVLPPMADEDVAALETAFRTQRTAALLATANTAQGGANVVKIEVFRPREAGEIYTSLHQESLRNIRLSPCPDIYWTDDNSMDPEGLQARLEEDRAKNGTSPQPAAEAPIPAVAQN